MNAKREMVRLKDEVSLLNILLEHCTVPTEHAEKDCNLDSNDCDKCVHRHYEKELIEKRDQWSKERDEEDRQEFEDWKLAGRPQA